MLELVAQSTGLRLLLLVLLFAFVVAIAYFIAQGIGARQVTRQRLLEGAQSGHGAPALGSLRNERVESSWLKLVNSIEQSGISLVDTKDAALRQRLIAAGFTATYAPRVYTLIRLMAVIGLPLLLLMLLAGSGATPSMFKMYLMLIVAAALGLYVPSLFVRATADRRQRVIFNCLLD